MTVVHLRDPAREWQYAITSDGKDKSRCGDDRNGSILEGELVGENNQIYKLWSVTLTSHRATTQMTFMGIWPPRPSTAS